jgi:hypothetical protein
MKWRHLITIVLVAAAIFLTAGYAFGNNESQQATPTIVAEPAPSLEDKAQFQQLAAVLNQSATGSYLLGLREAYKVTVRFEEGQGSSFNQAANRIRLDTSLEPVNAALIFAHEMNHARTFHEGMKAHRKSAARQDYVNQMLWEESEGMAVSIGVKMELEANGVEVAGISLPLENDYHEAYQAAVGLARESAPSLSDRQVDAIGRDAGVRALFDAHLRGETRTANTHEPCVDYYGRLWDEAHPLLAFLSGYLG